MHVSPVVWFAVIATVAFVLWTVLRRKKGPTTERDPEHLRTFVTFDAVLAESSDPGSVLFTRILAGLPKAIVVPPGQSTALAHTGYTNVGVSVGEWKADIFLGETDADTHLWTLFVETNPLIDTPELRTLLRGLHVAISSLPESSQVEWYKRESPTSSAPHPLDE